MKRIHETRTRMSVLTMTSEGFGDGASPAVHQSSTCSILQLYIDQQSLAYDDQTGVFHQFQTFIGWHFPKNLRCHIAGIALGGCRQHHWSTAGTLAASSQSPTQRTYQYDFRRAVIQCYMYPLAGVFQDTEQQEVDTNSWSELDDSRQEDFYKMRGT